MTDSVREFGIEEKGGRIFLRALYGLLRDIETDLCQIAENVSEGSPELWEKVEAYFRECCESLDTAYTLLEILKDADENWEEDCEFYYDEFVDDVFDEPDWDNVGC
jgi:hypothetical protein